MMDNKNKGPENFVEINETKQKFVHRPFPLYAARARDCNFIAFDLSQNCLEKVMETLVNPDVNLIGIYGSNDKLKETLVEKICRRVHRDKLFDMVVTSTVTKKPNVNKIQEEIAGQLGLTFHHKSKDERAKELIKRIKLEQKILIILCDLHKGLDLGKVGIPYGADRTGCRILLTSTSEDVLLNHMHTQINFNAGF